MQHSEQLVVDGLSVHLARLNGWVLDEVSFTMQAGEALGLVGESGAGKSMTARAIAGILPSDASTQGKIWFEGQPLSPIRGKGRDETARRRIGMIFQDARSHLDPRQRIGDFLLEPVRGGSARAEASDRALQLLERVGLAEPRHCMKQYPHEMSGGMLQRVMIAAAVLARPSLILADEATTALDVTTQAEVVQLLDELRTEEGTGLLFITHDLDLAALLCDRIAVMYAGTIQELRTARALCIAPLHPYTDALFSARPDVMERKVRLDVIPGQPVAAFEAPEGCAFAPRCRHVMDSCHVRTPPIRECEDGSVRCLKVSV